MADGTKIEWTEATWNPITGCAVTSPGCTNCYAMKLAGTRLQHHWSRKGLTQDTKAGPVWTGEVRLNMAWLTQPLNWKRPRMIFVCAHGDLFHESVPEEWIDQVFAVMALAPQHTFQVLTKRSARMREYCNAATQVGIIEAAWRIAPLSTWQWPPPNVWLGVSVEDQTRADERIPDLLATPAAVRWLSCEPLLGPVELTAIEVNQGDGEMDALNPLNISAEWREWCEADDSESEDETLAGFVEQYGRVPDGKPVHPTLDWVVCGGESGPGARPMRPDWARALRDQCAAAGVPFFFKQWGEWAPGEAFGLESDRPVTDRHGNVRDWMNRYVICADRGDRLRGHSFTAHATNLVYQVGKKRAGRLLDGVEHNAVPVPR